MGQFNQSSDTAYSDVRMVNQSVNQ